MDFEEFEKVVNEILKDIPEKYRKVLRDERIEVICREYVPMGVRQKFPGKIVFGLFAGISKGKKRTFDFTHRRAGRNNPGKPKTLSLGFGCLPFQPLEKTPCL